MTTALDACRELVEWFEFRKTFHHVTFPIENPPPFLATARRAIAEAEAVGATIDKALSDSIVIEAATPRGRPLSKAWLNEVAIAMTDGCGPQTTQEGKAALEAIVAGVPPPAPTLEAIRKTAEDIREDLVRGACPDVGRTVGRQFVHAVAIIDCLLNCPCQPKPAATYGTQADDFGTYTKQYDEKYGKPLPGAGAGLTKEARP